MTSTAGQIVGCLSAADTFVSGEEIAARLGITRAGVWKHIDALRRAGFEISSATNRGYRLTGIPDTPSPEVLSAMLNTVSLGRTIEYHPVISSTNERAMALAYRGAEEGTVVTADTQTAGRAKNGGRWESPPGKNLYVSVILRPNVPVNRTFELERIALESLAWAVSSMAPDLRLTLLSDGLFSEGGKIGGVLCEVCGMLEGIRHLVAGIGLNVSHHPDLPGTDSLFSLTGKMPSRARLTATLLERLEASYGKWRGSEKN